MLLSNDEKYETSLTGGKVNHSESMQNTAILSILFFLQRTICR